jgi:hypothetical protein
MKDKMTSPAAYTDAATEGNIDDDKYKSEMIGKTAVSWEIKSALIDFSGSRNA